MRLKDKITVITGSASGFGKGIAKKFTEEGSKIIMVDVNKKLLKSVSNYLFQDHFVADVSKSTDFKLLLKYIYKNYRKIDIIINNAGITHKPNQWKMLQRKNLIEFSMLMLNLSIIVGNILYLK